MKNKILIFILIIIIILLLMIFKDSLSVMHFGVVRYIHLAFPPKDLYKPILVSNFKLNIKGNSEEFYIKPIYNDYYEVGFMSENKSVSSQYRFNGKINIQISCNSKTYFTKEITAMESALYVKNDMNFYRKVVFTTFRFPNISYKDGVILKITVLEEDEKMDNFISKIKLYVAVSDRP